MEQQLYSRLRSRAGATKSAWERLLRIEKEISALGKADMLVHLIEPCLAELFRNLERKAPQVVSPTPFDRLCPCSRNPLVVFYWVGQQAVREAFVQSEFELRRSVRSEREAAFAELDSAFNEIAIREISAFCEVCRYRSDYKCAESTRSR